MPLKIKQIKYQQRNNQVVKNKTSSEFQNSNAQSQIVLSDMHLQDKPA